MKLFQDYKIVTAMWNQIGLTIKGMFTSPAFLISSSSTIGLFQIIYYQAELTIGMAQFVGAAFVAVSFLGIVKHMKNGEWKASIFLQKTIEQFVVMFSVILLAYLAAGVIWIAFKFFSGVEAPAPKMSIWFILSGYGIMFTYYFIKACDLVDQIAPKLLPKWFSAPFRKYRQSGNYQDLLGFKEEEVKSVNGVQQ